MLENPFEPVCFTNADIATANWYKYINDIIHQFVPRRTYHRQSLPPWVSSSTSHLMKILQTKRKQYEENPSDFRRNNTQQTERKLTIALECDRSSYLEKLSHTTDTHKLFKFFKNFKPECSMPSKICHGSKTAVSDVDKVNLLNQYFQSMFSADESFDLNYMGSFLNTDLLGKLDKLDSFDTSPVKIEHKLNSLDVSKTRGPDSLPPCFFLQLSSVISLSLSVLFKIIKRTGNFPLFGRSVQSRRCLNQDHPLKPAITDPLLC